VAFICQTRVLASNQQKKCSIRQASYKAKKRLACNPVQPKRSRNRESVLSK
jgi:hypothetical protein